MLKRLSKDDISAMTQARSSIARNIRKAILDQYPMLESTIDELFPKKAPMYLIKTPNVSFVCDDSNAYFLILRDNIYAPTLKFLHMYPNILPKVQVDRGAIKFVLKGADIMAPGLTSKGGHTGDPNINLPVDTVVAIQAEGKQHSIAIGVLKLSTSDIRTINKGTAIESITFLGDRLYQNPRFLFE
jgi:PUA domain protein